MSDECKYCEFRGNIHDCIDAECNRHESWYAKAQQKEIDNLRNALASAEIRLRKAENRNTNGFN